MATQMEKVLLEIDYQRPKYFFRDNGQCRLKKQEICDLYLYYTLGNLVTNQAMLNTWVLLYVGKDGQSSKYRWTRILSTTRYKLKVILVKMAYICPSTIDKDTWSCKVTKDTRGLTYHINESYEKSLTMKQWYLCHFVISSINTPN